MKIRTRRRRKLERRRDELTSEHEMVRAAMQGYAQEVQGKLNEMEQRRVGIAQELEKVMSELGS